MVCHSRSKFVQSGVIELIQVLNVLVRIVKPAKPVPEEVARQLTKRSHSQKSCARNFSAGPPVLLAVQPLVQILQI